MMSFQSFQLNIKCNNVFPSSVMAAATMFTGIESAYLARITMIGNLILKIFVSLQNTLKKNGYEIYSIDNSRTGREVTRPNSTFI